MEHVSVFEQVSHWLIGAVLPLFYLLLAVRAVETLLGWGRHWLAFKGVVRLKTFEIRAGLRLPADAEAAVGRVEDMLYLVNESRELLFAGWPGIFRVGYLLKCRAVDRGGIVSLEVSAPLSVCLVLVAVGAILLGLSMSGFASDGPWAGGIFLLLGAGLLALFVRRIRAQTSDAPERLETIVESLNEE